MIYLPLELRLKIIMEDLNAIKHKLEFLCWERSFCKSNCEECEFASSLGIGVNTCPAHAPEYAMRITFF